MKLKKAFTLIELLVVIAIIGLLASIVFINIRNAQSKSRDSKRKMEVGEIKKALESFRTDTGRFALCPNKEWQCGFADPASYFGGISGELWSTASKTIVSEDVAILKKLIHPFPVDPKIGKPYVYATCSNSGTSATCGYYDTYAMMIALENPTGLSYTDKVTAADGKKYYKCLTGVNFTGHGFFEDWGNSHSGSTDLGYVQTCNF